MFLTEILAAERGEEGVGVVGLRVPHHRGVGTHLHEKLTQVARVHHTERERTLRLHVAIVVLHLPRTLCRSKMRPRGVELKVHVVAQLHVILVVPSHEVVVGIVVAASCHECP